MVLYNTNTKQVIEDAVEQKTSMPNLSIWLHEDGRPIAFSTELKNGGYKILSEDAPEVINARLKEEKKRKQIELEWEEARKKKEEEEAAKAAEEHKKAEEDARNKERLARLQRIVPTENDDMPAWFQEYIKSLNITCGRQNGIRRTYTFSEDDWNNYFDSSFPSTFMSGYKIVRNLINNNVVKDKYKDLTTIKIADIGCGSGGASIGAITAIEQFLPNVLEIDICAFDYNENALNVFENCLKAYQPDNEKICINKQQIKFVPVCSDVKHNKYTLEDFGDYLKNDTYDFILCFKMVNELIFNHKFRGDTYKNLAHVASPHISKQGFFILLDVSQSNEKDESGKSIDDTKYARLLNTQVNKFLSENEDFGCIIPIPCAIVSTKCDADYCWIQRYFKSDGGREFPATYKVLTRWPFRDEILKSIEVEDSSKYIVCEKKETDGRSKEYKRCFYTNGKRTRVEEISENNIQNYKDGFSLN